MKKEIVQYMEDIQKAAGNKNTDRKKLAEGMLTRIQFYQHERLIHLIVTMSFGVFFLISLILCFNNTAFLALAILLLALLIPYIGHYYYLENSVQKLYIIYYTISETDIECSTGPDKDKQIPQNRTKNRK